MIEAHNQIRQVSSGVGRWLAVAVAGVLGVALFGVAPAAADYVWNAAASVPSNYWRAATYGCPTPTSCIWVAVSSDGTNRVMTSTDGASWTSRASADESTLWYSVTFGNGQFVAVGSSAAGSRAMTSHDGITWTAQTAPEASWTAVTYANGLFVALSTAGTAITSTDGVTWDSRTMVSGSWTSITYGNGQFVAVAQSSSVARVATSPDGIT